MSTESPLTEHHLCRRHGAGFLHIYCLLESVFSLALVHDQSDSLRYAQLLPFDEGYIADTPGFGNLLFEDFDEKNLVDCFKEFADFEDGCKFCPCNHTHEPVCGVKEAVASGEVAQSRYQSYLDILQEIKEIKEKEGKRLW